MKKLILWSIIMLSLSRAHAQTQTGLPVPDLQPDIIIKAESLKNFPGADLEEMLRGRLPGLNVFHAADQESDVVYIVDGFVRASVQGLNIHNIDEIAFYRGGLNHQLGVQNIKPQGVIYIKTKRGQYNHKLTNQVNALAGVNHFNTEGIEDNRNIMQSYNVALQQGSDKLAWRGSLGYNRATRNQYEPNRGRQLQFNGDLSYQPAKWMEFGFNFNYAPENWRTEPQSSKLSPSVRQTKYLLAEHKDCSSRLSLKLNFGGGWSNQFSYLKYSNKLEDTLHRTTEYIHVPDYIYNYEDNVLQSLRNTSIINELSYRFALNDDQITIRTGALFQYNKLSQRNEAETRAFFGLAESYTQSTMEQQWSNRQNSIAISASADIYKLLTVQTGLRADNGAYFGDKKFSYSPYGYVDLSVKQALLKDAKHITSFILFASFGQDRTTIGFNNQVSPWGYSSPTPIIPGYVLNRDYEVTDRRSETLSAGMKSSFFDNRLKFVLDWYQSDYFAPWVVQIPGAVSGSVGYASFTSLVPVRFSGWRTWLNVDLLQSSSLKWSTAFYINKNNVKTRKMQGYDLTPHSGELQYNNTKPQAGMQHQFSYNKFYLSANAYVYVDQPHTQIDDTTWPMPTMSVVEGTLYNLNYLTLGYTFNRISTVQSDKDLRISLVGRNLLQHKEGGFDNYLSKTIGIALNLQF